MDTAFWVFGAILIAANSFVSFRLLKSASYDTAQKLGQTVMVWLVPVLGATLIWHFLREEKMKRHTTDLADRIGHGDGSGQYERAVPESEGGDSGGGDGGGE